MRTSFGHYAQDENDFEGYCLHGGVWVEVTLTLEDEEPLPDWFVDEIPQ